jgi:hypothetical protein
VQAGDDFGDGVTNAGELAQPAIADDLGQRHRQGAEALGRTGISLGAIGIAAAQGDALPEFAQQVDDFRGVEHWHGEEQTLEQSNGSSAAVLPRRPF